MPNSISAFDNDEEPDDHDEEFLACKVYHEKQRAHSAELLHCARDHAAKIHKYNSFEARKTMTEECNAHSGGVITPFPWQLDVAESLLLGMNCELIAPTGVGKTIPFVLPHFVSSNKVTLIISPLNALEVDQVCLRHCLIFVLTSYSQVR